MNHTIIKILCLIVISIMITACASGPDKQKPTAVESGYNSLGIGVESYNNSKYEQALSQFHSALFTFRSIDHQKGIASSCLNLAKAHLQKNQNDLARTYLDIADTLIQQSNINTLKNHLVITQSSLAIKNNQLSKAKKLLAPLLNNKTKNAFTLAALQNRIRIAFTENDINGAQFYTTKFSTALAGLAENSYHARLHRFQAKLSKNSNTATSEYKRALGIYRKSAHKPGISSTLHEWGEHLLQQNQLDIAEDKLLRALFIRQNIQDEAGSIRVLISLNAIYTQRKADKQINKTIRWINKLSKERFNLWSVFTNEYDQFRVR